MLGFLFPLFGKYAADNLKSAVERTKFQALCGAGIAVALLFALLFICLALFLLLSEFMPPVKAAAVLALVWLLIAAAGIICLRAHAAKRARERRARRLLNPESAKLVSGAALSLAPGLIGLGGKSWRRLGLLAAAAVSAAAAYGALHKRGGEEDKDA